MPPLHAVVALALIAAVPAAAPARDENPKPRQSVPAAKGEIVPGLGKSVMYVFQAKNNDYWFGSNDRGVYRYDGKSLTNFTTKDGLVSDQIRGIQEDQSGGLYFTTYKGISKFDGTSFATLPVSADTAPTDWTKQPDDLWFVGPPDTGTVYRSDGKSLHRLKIPTSKLGDEHFAKYPRDKFPNAKYSPYDVYVILKDSKGNLWFGTSHVGVLRYDGKSFEWLTGKGLTGAPVRSIVEDRKGNYWFSGSGYLAVSDFAKVQERGKGTIVVGLSVIEDDNGKIWTGAFRAGAIRYEGTKEVAYPIKDGNTLVEVFAISKDNRGVLWLGTHNGGAYKFNGTTFEKFQP
jgi:ligand-binding sensor domain-containing protein